uniref:Uncharacterized protein n=1 Tax=Romanomermis culicivorax TaxID=13658 RepID=A0A915L5X4_ROMCU
PNLAFDLPRELPHHLALDSVYQLPLDSPCDLPQTSVRHFPHDLARHLPHGFMSPFSTAVVYCLARESPHHVECIPQLVITSENKYSLTA